MSKETAEIAASLSYAATQFIVLDEELRSIRANLQHFIDKGVEISLEEAMRMIRRIDRALS